MNSTTTSERVLLHIVPAGYVALLLLLAASSIACSLDNAQPGIPPPGSGQAGGDQPDTSKQKHAFRGIFVATAYNMDWPTRQGRHPRALSDEIRAIVGRAKELNCNVIILQVRAFGDRLHRNTRFPSEPWSLALNPGDGDQRDPDKKPVPDYDPLIDWITQCHDAGIELHAWVNPFRVDRIVRDAAGKPFGLLASDDYNTVYLDYTQTDVQEYVLAVIEELLSVRTPSPATVTIPGGGAIRAANKEGEGIDGLLFDHNLPHDHHNGGTSRPTTLFSAPPRYTRHQLRVRWLANTNTQEKGPRNLDDFIEAVFRKAHGVHRVKFGFSPMYNDPHNETEGMKWLDRGWVNYVIPELYIESEGRSFQNELGKWLDLVHPQSGFTPIVVAGLFTTRVQSPAEGSDKRWPPTVTIGQIHASNPVQNHRGTSASGQAHYSWSALRSPLWGGPDAQDDSPDPRKKKTLEEKLKEKGVYDQPALVPNCTAPPAESPPGTPIVSLTGGTASWALPERNKTKILVWAVWTREPGRRGPEWGDMQVFKRSVKSISVGKSVDRVAVKAIDHYNRESDFGISSR